MALQKAASAEADELDRLADLAGCETALRGTLDTLGPRIESARSELADLQSQLEPLRDWKQSMNQRYARLSDVPKGSAEEKALWREIEDAQAALFDLLPAARIDAPALTPGDSTRISARVRVPIKSDRIRRLTS